MTEPREHKGWYLPRGLPHFDTPERPQFITFRLNDSLPAGIAVKRSGEGDANYRRRIETALDAGNGACWLARPDLAAIVAEAFAHGHGETYDLHAFVVMPNHVHALVVFYEGRRLFDVIQAWKSFSAHRINAVLGRSGPFWQKDYFDRYLRDEAEFERVRFYIEDNPVRAGLPKSAADWQFSSAR